MKKVTIILAVLLAGNLSSFAQQSNRQNFSGIQPSALVEPTLRCFQNGRQVLQETGQFVSNKKSGKNIYRFGNQAGGVSIIMFDLGETVCTLTKLSSK